MYRPNLQSVALAVPEIIAIVHCELKENWATFIFTVTLANVDRFQ